MLGQIQFEQANLPIAKAWHRHAVGYLSDRQPSRELGLTHCLGARIALLEGDFEQTSSDAEATLALGKKLEDADLEALGLLYTGHAQIALGRIEAGLANQDEAAAAALAGLLTPWVAGLIYCGVIWACRNRGDWDRAAQWTEQFERWCKRNDLNAFPGTCRLHRAEILSIRGNVDEAKREILAASELLASWAPWAAGDAHRILGDLRLSCGDHAGAEDAYKKAHESGWDPQPGYALLQMERGETDAALRALERSLEDRTWANGERRGRLLAAYAMVAAEAGATDLGQKALKELDASPNLWTTVSLEALVCCARAEVAYSAGRLREAMSLLRNALKLWRRVPSPLRVANLQVRLAELLIEDGDPGAAQMEVSAAEAAFERAGAAAMVERCRRLEKACGP
jgi:tetratricopeptide (TPR) repeat protein